MKYQWIVVLLFYVFFLLQRHNCESVSSLSWTSFIKELIVALRSCKGSPITQKVTSDNPMRNLTTCLKKLFLIKFDDMISTDVIQIMNGVKLIRTTLHIGATYKSTVENIKNNVSNASTEVGWIGQVLKSTSKLFATHALQINLYELAKEEPVSHGRRRKHRHNMMMAMVFGITALGSVIVPLGFQFLAVLGGKALLLAKLALLLASVNGLKRVATSGIHYGLYQVPEHVSYGHYDRGDYTPRRSHSTAFR